MDQPSSSKDSVPFNFVHNIKQNGLNTGNNCFMNDAILNKEDVIEAVRHELKALKIPKTVENKIKLKLSYRDEKRCLMANRPLRFESLEESILKVFKHDLNIYYKPEGNGVLIAIRSQEDLDNAIKIIDRERLTSLRLLLSQRQTNVESNWTLQPNSSGTYTSNIVEVPYSETCSSCGAGTRQSLGRSGTDSVGPSLSQTDLDDGLQSAKAPIRWKKGKEIGKGAFGSVYVAHDVDTGRDVAVKSIPLIPLNRESATQTKGLEHDIRLLAQLQHPRVIQYLGVQNTSDAILIFMEYMPGGSVKDLIIIEEKLSRNLSVRYTRQILEGLAYLHKSNIVHRDIKPANILRDIKGNVKIGDFGSGKKIQSLSSRPQEGGINGTIVYIAPEVLRGLHAFGRKADVWSVGITLVEMLMGKTPWYGLETLHAMQKIVYEDPPIDYESIDEQVSSLVKQLLTREPNERPMAEEVLLNNSLFK